MSWNKPIPRIPEARRTLPKKTIVALLGIVVAACLFILVRLAFTRIGSEDVSTGGTQKHEVVKVARRNQSGSTSCAIGTSGSNPTNLEFEHIRELPDVQAFNEPPPPLQISSFDHSIDQVISMTVNTEGPIAPIPYETNMEEDFQRSLETEILINEDDPESVKQAKQNVIEAKNSIKRLLAEGMSVREALEEHRNQSNFNYDMRTSVQIEAQQLYDAGDVEGAHEYVVKMNAVLDQFGIEQVDFPVSAEERRKQAWSKRETSK